MNPQTVNGIMPARRWLAVVLAGLIGCAAPLVAAADKEAALSAWSAAAQYLHNEAYREFARLNRGAADGRSEQLGLALSLLGAQPVTGEKLAESRRLLRDLADGEDDAAYAARYFLGRIAQNFQERPDFAEAAAQYEWLIAHAADTYWGQMAAGKLAVLMLYALPAPEAAARVARAEALLARAQPLLARDLRIMIAEAILFHGLPSEPALAHLIAADELNTRIGQPALTAGQEADLLVQIINLSLRAGDRARADAVAERFKTRHPRDWRIYTLTQLLEADADGRPLPVP